MLRGMTQKRGRYRTPPVNLATRRICSASSRTDGNGSSRSVRQTARNVRVHMFVCRHHGGARTGRPRRPSVQYATTGRQPPPAASHTRCLFVQPATRTPAAARNNSRKRSNLHNVHAGRQKNAHALTCPGWYTCQVERRSRTRRAEQTENAERAPRKQNIAYT
jgi:hypothetical protein